MTTPQDACKPAGMIVADVLADILGTDLPATVGLSGLKPLRPPPEEARLQGAVTRVNGTRHPGRPDGL
jgi:hypothetical protein